MFQLDNDNYVRAAECYNELLKMEPGNIDFLKVNLML